MKGRPGDRRPDGRHGLLLLHHLPGRPVFPYGKRRHHPRPVDQQHPAWPPEHELRFYPLPRHRGPRQAPHPGHPHPASPPHCRPEGPLAAPSRPFPAGIPRQPRIPCGSFPEGTQIFCSFPWKTVDKPGFPRYTNRAALNGSKCAQKRHPRQRARNEGVEIRE